MNLVSICVDVVQSCEGKADLSNPLLVGLRAERRVVRLMVGEIVSKPSDELYSSPSVSERGRATGCEISHCPTRCVPFVYRREQM